MATFGGHLLTWRQFRRLTQAELARRAGVTPLTVSRIECGRMDPSLRTLRRLSSALDVTVGALMEKPPSPPSLDRHGLDRVARAALKMERPAVRFLPLVRRVSRIIEPMLAARDGRPIPPAAAAGERAVRNLRAELGEELWLALLRRIEKHISLSSRRPDAPLRGTIRYPDENP